MIEGRPAGVQIIGRRFREDLILNAMQKIEEREGILTEIGRASCRERV